MTITLQIRLDKFHNLFLMKLAKSHNLTILKTDLDTGLGTRLKCKLAKSLTETSSKVHEPKTYNEVINN